MTFELQCSHSAVGPAASPHPGPIRLTPLTPEVGRPYYQAETTLQVLDLIQDPEGGSNSLSWWTRSQPIRTAAEMRLRFAIVEFRPPPRYVQIAEKAAELRRLGMSACAIARTLGVTDKTVAKALRSRG